MTTAEVISAMLPLNSPELVKCLGSMAEIREYKRGEHIYDIGDVQKKIYFLMNGILRCYFIDELQTEITDSFMTECGMVANSPDIFLGEEIPSVIGVEVLADAAICELPVENVLALMQKEPRLVKIYIHCLHQSLEFQNEINSKRLYLSGNKRYQWFCEKWPEVEKIAGNQQIASFLGMRSESLSRLRHQNRKIQAK